MSAETQSEATGALAHQDTNYYPMAEHAKILMSALFKVFSVAQTKCALTHEGATSVLTHPVPPATKEDAIQAPATDLALPD